MAGEVLILSQVVTPLAPGASASWDPSLVSAGGVALAPNIVMPTSGTALAVVGTPTATNVTVINNGTALEGATFRCQYEWPGIGRPPGAAGTTMFWQGLGAGAGGGGAGVNKAPVRAATTAALAANTRSGNVLTANANGALAAVDGVTLVVGDRVLVKNEGLAANNGIYDVTSAGSGGAPWVLTRSSDADTSAEVKANMWTTVEEGSTLNDTGFLLQTNNPITLNTTALNFIKRFVFNLGGTYTNGSAAAAQIIQLDTTRNAIGIADAAGGIAAAGTALFGVTNFGGSRTYLNITNATGASWNVNTYSVAIDDNAEAGIADVSRPILRVNPNVYNNSAGAFLNSELIAIDFNTVNGPNFGAGTLALQRNMVVQGPTYTASVAKTITEAVTLWAGTPQAGAGPVSFTRSFAVLATQSVAANAADVAARNTNNSNVATTRLSNVSGGGTDAGAFGWNMDAAGFAQDDATKVSWQIYMDGTSDTMYWFHKPAGGARVTAATIAGPALAVDGTTVLALLVHTTGGGAGPHLRAVTLGADVAGFRTLQVAT